MTGLVELVINSRQLAYAGEGADSLVRLPVGRLARTVWNIARWRVEYCEIQKGPGIASTWP